MQSDVNNIIQTHYTRMNLSETILATLKSR